MSPRFKILWLTLGAIFRGFNPNFSINVWPNPSNGSFNYRHDVSSPVSITVTDVAGKVVYRANEIQEQSGTLTLNIKPGIYLFSLLDGGHFSAVHKQIIIQ